MRGDDKGALCEGPAGVALTELACEERAAARGVLPAPLVFELLALDRGVPFTEVRLERLDAGDDMTCVQLRFVESSSVYSMYALAQKKSRARGSALHYTRLR